MSKLQNMFALCSLYWSFYADTCAAGKFAHPFLFTFLKILQILCQVIGSSWVWALLRNGGSHSLS